MLKTYYELIVGFKTNDSLDIVDTLRSKKYCPHNTILKEKQLEKFVKNENFLVICKVIDYKTFEFVEVFEITDIYNFFKKENIQINIKHLVFGYFNFMRDTQFLQIVCNLNQENISNDEVKSIILKNSNNLFGYIGTFKIKIFKDKSIQHLNFLEDLVWWEN